jgi:hypothetical protein
MDGARAIGAKERRPFANENAHCMTASSLLATAVSGARPRSDQSLLMKNLLGFASIHSRSLARTSTHPEAARSAS